MNRADFKSLHYKKITNTDIFTNEHEIKKNLQTKTEINAPPDFTTSQEFEPGVSVG